MAFLRFPVDVIGITKHFSATHRGIDLGWADIPNPPIYAAGSGKVISARIELSTGAKYVVIRHADEGGKVMLTRYWHLDSFCVKAGQLVQIGQEIGRMGRTGKANGVHLHFEVNIFPASKTIFTERQCQAAAVDPLLYTYCFLDQKAVSGESVPIYNGTIQDVLFESYVGKVTALAGLNIRTSPNGLKVGALKYGAVVQIVGERDGWGELATGGWVSLKYIKRV